MQTSNERMSLTIEMQNFKCYDAASFTFNDGISLLCGKSGSGKSTIFQAVLWCFYGTIKGIKPRGNKNSKSATFVVVRFDNYIIWRINSPKEFHVMGEGINLVDDEAQEFVNRLFGDESFFVTSSYLVQGERCLLLEGKNSEKVELLNSIIYGSPTGGNSDFFISQLKPLVIQTEGTLQALSMKKSILDSELKLLGTLKLDPGIDKPEQELTKRTLYLEELQLKKGIQQELMKRIEALRTEVSQSNEFHFRKGELDEVEHELHMKREKMQLSTKLLMKYNDYIAKMKQLEELGIEESALSSGGSGESYTIEIINKTKAIETIRAESIAICKKYNIEYNQSKVTSTINVISEVLKNYHSIDEYLEFKNFKPIEDQLELIDSLRKRVYQLTEAKSFKKCPFCGENVIISGGELKKPTNGDQVDGDLAQVKIKLSEAELLQKGHLRWKYLSEKFHDLEIHEEVLSMRKYKYQDIACMYESLKRIQVIDEPRVSSMIMINSNKLQEVQKKIKELKNIERVEPVDLSTLDKEITGLNRRKSVLEREISMSLEHDKKMKELKELNERVDPTIEEKLPLVRKEIQYYKDQLAILENIKKCNILRGKVASIGAEIQINMKKLSNLQNLLGIISRAEKMTYENAIDTINFSLQRIIPEIFDDPVSIELDSMKEKLSLSVNSRGRDAKFSSMSGGEMDRISLALLLSIGMIKTCPFLFIDESISSLDLEMKEKCIQAIRKYSTARFIIVVNHEAIEGSYDSVVNLD
jgi:exonuclease SbcC